MQYAYVNFGFYVNKHDKYIMLAGGKISLLVYTNNLYWVQNPNG